jgi:hypothetical protein
MPGMTESTKPVPISRDDLHRLLQSAADAFEKPILNISFIGTEQDEKRLVKGSLLFDGGPFPFELYANCYEDIDATVRPGSGTILHLFGTRTTIEALIARSRPDKPNNGVINIAFELTKLQGVESSFTFRCTGSHKVEVMMTFKK